MFLKAVRPSDTLKQGSDFDNCLLQQFYGFMLDRSTMRTYESVQARVLEG